MQIHALTLHIPPMDRMTWRSRWSAHVWLVNWKKAKKFVVVNTESESDEYEPNRLRPLSHNIKMIIKFILLACPF